MNKILKDGYDFFFWNYEKQTKIKHFVFKAYFNMWVKILGKQNILNFFDCYGGCGSYIDEKEQVYYGSPILAAETIEKNAEKLNRKVNLVIIEQDEENIENLKKIFEYKKIKTEPVIIRGDFDNAINRILDNAKNNLNPTFFFIDPFGFTIKYKTIKRIMAIPKSEIFLNFMFTQVNRFLIDNIEQVLNELFGCEDWKKSRNLTGKQREYGLVELFRAQLKKIARFVFYYRMSFPHKERTYYYLFHLTNHYKGCLIMKSCFAKFNYGKVEYRGPKHGQKTLFDLQEIKIDEMQNYFSGKYFKCEKIYNEIILENIDEVPYLEGEIKKALKTMELENKICVKRIDSKTNRGLQGNDLITFN